MKLLCFQAKRFRWKTHSKTLPEVVDQEIDREVAEAVIVFVHAEESDAADDRQASVLRQSVKHIKWLANKRGLKNIVLHSFSHLGGDTAQPVFAESFIETAAARLRETGYEVCLTPFGYFCEWDLSVYGESLAKVWKEIH
ncbi:MAG: threonyl-tRNA synthetase editing domain-containing protein [Candidatus Binatia bacterium]